jgi:hypothetical protein
VSVKLIKLGFPGGEFVIEIVSVDVPPLTMEAGVKLWEAETMLPHAGEEKTVTAMIDKAILRKLHNPDFNFFLRRPSHFLWPCCILQLLRSSAAQRNPCFATVPRMIIICFQIAVKIIVLNHLPSFTLMTRST